MSIQVLPERTGIGKGLSSGMDALQEAFKTSGDRRYAESQAEQQRNRQQVQIGALGQALSAAQQETDPIARMSAFQNALAQTGVSLPPETAMNYLKSISEAQKSASDPIRAAEERQTHKTNQTLVAGLAADSRVAKGLYSDIEKLSSAIEGGKLRGPGLPGDVTKAFRWMSGKGRPGDEQTIDTLRKEALMQLGSLKGIRLTDLKLRFLEDSLFNPQKSLAENREALRIYKDTLERKMSYPERVKQLLKENPNAMHDPMFSINVDSLLEPNKDDWVAPTFENYENKEGGGIFSGVGTGGSITTKMKVKSSTPSTGREPTLDELIANMEKNRKQKTK